MAQQSDKGKPDKKGVLKIVNVFVKLWPLLPTNEFSVFGKGVVPYIPFIKGKVYFFLGPFNGFDVVAGGYHGFYVIVHFHGFCQIVFHFVFLVAKIGVE
jgi:hypothetical protein